jgi:hypothetical protein
LLDEEDTTTPLPAEQAASGLAARLAASIVPSRSPAATIYGLVAVGALVAAESGLHETYLATLVSAVIAACVYWLMHAYATVLGRRLGRGERLTAGGLTRALADNRAVLRGAGLPIGALLLAWLAGAEQETGVTVAMWTTVAGLVVFEVAAGVRAGAMRSELALETAVGVALGVGVVLVRIVH